MSSSSSRGSEPAAVVKATGVSVVAGAGNRSDATGADEAFDPVSITACPGGPLLVRGNFEVVDAEGTPVPKNRETVALCRCGGSKIKPWCDGAHKLLRQRSAAD